MFDKDNCKSSQQKRIRAKNVTPVIQKLNAWGVFKHLEAVGADNYMTAMLEYICRADTAEACDLNQLMDTLADMIPTQRDNIMNVRQQLIQIGIKEGIQKGIALGRQQGIAEGIDKVEKKG